MRKSTPTALLLLGLLSSAYTQTLKVEGTIEINGTPQKVTGTLQLSPLPTPTPPSDTVITQAPGLVKRLKAGNLSLADGQGVAVWNDLAGVSDAVQPNIPLQPQFKGVCANSKPCVRFDGADDRLQFAAISDLRTVYLVIKHDSGTDSLYGPVLGHATSYDFIGRWGSDLIGYQYAGAGVRSSQAWMNGKPVPWHGLYKPATPRVISIVTGSPTSVDRLGNDRGFYTWKGDYYEVILYNQPHTDSQRQAIENYLIAYYNTQTTGPQVIAIGNSITEEYNSTDGQTYPAQLLGMLPGWDVVNLGIGGQTTLQIAARSTETDLLFDSTRSKNVLVFLEGTNHLGSGASSQEAYNAIRDYCLARKAAGFKVVVVTIPPRSDLAVGGQGGAGQLLFEEKRTWVNTQIRLNWATFADALADLALDPDMGPNGASQNTAYYSDGVHPINLGMTRIATLVKGAISAIP